MSVLDQVVYIIDSKNGELAVHEVRMRDLMHHVEKSCRPHGIGNAYYVREVELEADDEGDEDAPGQATKTVYLLCAYQHGKERVVREFETEQQAVDVLEDGFAQDIMSDQSISVYYDRAQADQALTAALDD